MKKKLMTLQQHRLLKEAGRLIAFSERLKHAQKETTGRNREEREEKCRRSAKAASAVAALSGDIEEFLASRYDFRYNLLTDETEFRAAGQRSAAFTPVGKRELNTFCIEAHAEGIPCWDKDLNRYVYSTYIPAYHPFLLYMDELPDWDGKDRLTALACRVSSRPHWVRGFHTWMLGLASQWMGVSGLHANSVAPVLVSREQGRRKSSFCRALMPDVLARYYTDNLKLTSQGQAERMLAEMGMLNMDEFDKYAESKMPLLKNLMQMSVLNIRKAYQQNFRQLPRIASFIGTSNRFDLLTDPTGSPAFPLHRGEARHRLHRHRARPDFRPTESGTHCRAAQLVHQVGGGGTATAQRGFLSCQPCRGGGSQLVPCPASGGEEHRPDCRRHL